MKRMIFCMAVLCSALAAGAVEAEEADSILCFQKPDSVVVKHSGERVKVEVYGVPENPDYYYSYTRSGQESDNEIVSEGSTNWDFKIPFVESKKKSTRKPRFSFEVGGVGIGFVNAMNAPAPMDVDMGSSYEIFADHLLNLRCYPWASKKSSFSIGFGIGWRNYRMTGITRFVKDNGSISFDSYPENADVKFSRIKIFSWTVPVMFQQELGRDFTWRIGAVVNFNTYGSMKTVYKVDGEENKYFTDNIHQQRVTVDLMTGLDFKAIGWYVKYSPCNTLHSDFGPSFNHLSTGLTIFY